MPDPHATSREAKETLVRVLDVLRGLNPRQRRYLRDYPDRRGDRLPTPPRDRDILLFVTSSLLASHGARHALTRLGKIAREEIRRGELYIAAHYPAMD